MFVEFFCLQFLDFYTEKKDHVDGVNAWYLSPEENSSMIIGKRPNKKFFGSQFKPVLSAGGIGKYEVTTDLNGRVVSLKKVN